MEGAFKIQDKIWSAENEVVKGDFDELMKRLYDIGNDAVTYKELLDALESAINTTLSKEDAEKIYDKASDILRDYYYEGIPEEDIKKMEEYGYCQPAYLCEDLDEAMDYMDDGFGILLLKQDDTAELCFQPGEATMHFRQGGLLGLRPFDVQKAAAMCLEDAVTNIDKE